MNGERVEWSGTLVPSGLINPLKALHRQTIAALLCVGACGLSIGPGSTSLSECVVFAEARGGHRWTVVYELKATLDLKNAFGFAVSSKDHRNCLDARTGCSNRIPHQRRFGGEL